MSASFISITASPSAANRRKPMVSGENKRSNIELVNDAIADKNAVPGNVNAGVIDGGTNQDLNHAIRSKDAVQIKKTSQPISTPHPRRTRKMASSKPERPRWRTVLRVFTKNFLLLLVLSGLVQMVRKLVVNIRSDGSANLAEFSEIEIRISNVESYIKTTTKMLQAQLETAEEKADGEISSLRGEMNKKFEDTSEDIASRLERLNEKTEFLEEALGRLESKDLLSKDDLARLYDELRGKSGDLSHSELSLDEIKELARKIVEKEIDKHAADGLGRVDYALATAGALVVKHSEPFVVGRGGNWFSSMNRQGVHSDAEKMLKPSFGEPGQCFPLKGDSGFVQIKLRTAIIPEAITLEHVSKIIAYDRSSAPRDCKAYGWQGGEIAFDGEKMLLTEFTYDLEKSNAQTFHVFDSASSAVVDTIRFDFTSNHGNPSHTCIYRVRVHGQAPKYLTHSQI